MKTKKLILKLEQDYEELKNICEKLWEQRYDPQKYEDKWYDELYEQYKHIKYRINLLFELFLDDQADS